ncbi:MAG TPA: PIG-L family deacetylase [Tichowtungia sp.]|nr:PIG-L family deacetylase [Tichowtungia sp.]
MNPYLEFVQHIEANVQSAKGLTVSGSTGPKQSDQKVLLFSPHPDDECITGLLPLRLMREAGMQIINGPVTFGSNIERRPARAKELADACAYLGWEVFQPLERKKGAGSACFQPLEKSDAVELLKTIRPRIVFTPHSRDWNSRHVATHHLVMDALAEMSTDFCCTVIETEYWGAMDDPNLMVEGDAMLVADLVAATSLHVGEVARNPYHLLLPAWMQDNVRRGGELVGGQGQAAPDFSFATLYRVSEWENGKLVQWLENGTMVPMGMDLKELFNREEHRERKRRIAHESLE